jgi:hypothetical protein
VELPEVKAAFSAVRNVRNLPRRRIHLPSNTPNEMRKARTKLNDILEWLASEFGFQVTCYLAVFMYFYLVTLLNCVNFLREHTTSSIVSVL